MGQPQFSIRQNRSGKPPRYPGRKSTSFLLNIDILAKLRALSLARNLSQAQVLTHLIEDATP